MRYDPSRDTIYYMLPGQRVKISTDGNYFIRTDPITRNGETQELTRGFFEESGGVTGTLEPTETEEAAVYYKHNKPIENVIWFYARTGEIGRVLISAVPIHDHSSIVQGGPAFGTYFSDDQEEEST